MYRNNQYDVFDHPTLGMQMVPKRGSPIDRAVRRLRFNDSRTRD